MIDRIGSRKVILAMSTVLAIDNVLMPWTSAQLWTAVPAILIWGAAGCGLLVPQQYRLVSLAPSIPPVLLGLNTAGSFFGISAAGVVGAAGIEAVGAHNLGIVGAALAVGAFLVAEMAVMRIAAAAASADTKPLRSAAGVAHAQPVPSTTATTAYHRVEVEGVNIFYREAGPKDAPTIVLLHRFPSSSREFDPLIPLLATRLVNRRASCLPNRPKAGRRNRGGRSSCLQIGRRAASGTRLSVGRGNVRCYG